jgi:hypothetical protein
MKLMKTMINVLHPVLQWIGKIHSPWSHKLVTGYDYLKVRDLIKPGDVLLTRTYGELSSLIIPSHWKHAAIYLGTEMIGEATQNGVRSDYLSTFMLHKDEVKVLRPLFLSDIECKEAALYALNQIGVPYDFAYEETVKAFYCSELVRSAYEHAWELKHAPEPFPFELRIRAGIKTVSPDDFDKATSKFGVVYCSSSFN